MDGASKNDSSDAARLRGVLTRWLAAHWPQAEAVVVDELATPQGTGNSNQTVFFRANWRQDGVPRSGRYVLRVEPTQPPVYPSQTFVALPSVEVQYRAMRAVADHTSVPIAPLLGYEPDPALLGGPFFVMGYVNGQVPSDTPPYTQQGFLVEGATPEQRRRVIESGLEAMIRLHGINWRDADLAWLVPEGQAPGLGWQLELHRTYARQLLGNRQHPILDQAFAFLEREFPGELPLTLSWGDARIGNMIFDHFECAAVTDWEAVCLGPAELDLGWWLMFDHHTHEGAAGYLQSGPAARLAGMPTREEQKTYYAALAGRPIGDTHYFEVFAAMRFSTSMIRVGDRHTAAGLAPPELNLPVHNPGTQVLADLLEIPYRWMEASR